MLPPVRPELEPLDRDELAALPIFPLPRIVLLPGAALPLHVFEPRYREMMTSCLTEGPRAIAMAMLAPGWERDYEGRPAIEPIAGAGRIVASRQNPDGTYDLVLVGVARVRLDELPPERAFRRARAAVLDDGATTDSPELRRALEPVLATASSLAALDRQKGLPAPELDGSPGRIVDRLADRWVHQAAQRQAVLEALDVGARIRLVGDALATMLAMLSRTGGSTAN